MEFETSFDFFRQLPPDKQSLLRRVVKAVHLKHYPGEFQTDHEADKFIAEALTAEQVRQMFDKAEKVRANLKLQS